MAFSIDRFPHTVVAQFAIVLQICATVALNTGILCGNFNCVLLGLALWAVAYEGSDSLATCVLAETPTNAERVKLSGKRNVYRCCGAALGLLTSMIIFWFSGSVWTYKACKNTVVSTVTVCCLLNALCLSHIKDSSSFHWETSTGVINQAPLLLVNQQQQEIENLKPKYHQKYKKYVPYNILAAGFIRACGAGMTVRFFNLYFINIFHMGPLLVQTIAVAVMLCVAGSSALTVRAATVIGCGRTSLLCNILGCVLLATLLTTSKPFLFVMCHLLRSAVQNGVASVEQGMVLNTTNSAHRGKWTAVESVITVSWYGSSVIGGRLADRWGYKTSFAVTLGFYIICTLSLIPVAVVYSDDDESANS